MANASKIRDAHQDKRRSLPAHSRQLVVILICHICTTVSEEFTQIVQDYRSQVQLVKRQVPSCKITNLSALILLVTPVQL